MSGPRSHGQLALSLDHAERFGREDFLEGPPNAAALALVERWPDWPASVVMLVGPEGAGKSHLAAIWAASAGARIVAAAGLSESDLPDLTSGPLVVEDLTAGGFDEKTLFHLLNLARQEGTFAILTARTSPTGWRFAIRDLASRLRAVPVVHLAPPDDALLRAVIVKLFADRQIGVDEGLVNYLTMRIERSFAAARSAVVALDREALSRQRPVTRALAADLFRAQGEQDESHAENPRETF